MVDNDQEQIFKKMRVIIEFIAREPIFDARRQPTGLHESPVGVDTIGAFDR